MNKLQFHFIKNGTPDVPVVSVAKEDSPNKEIFDEIFKVDPHTGLPCNAQQVFLSQDTNPLIKDFIASVLKGNDSQMKDSTFKDLPDSVVSELTINHGETRVAYLDRISNYLDSQKSEINASIERYRSVANKVPPKQNE